eukprot:360874-Chlamydomonas_euryale.AAC.7
MTQALRVQSCDFDEAPTYVLVYGYVACVKEPNCNNLKNDQRPQRKGKDLKTPSQPRLPNPIQAICSRKLHARMRACVHGGMPRTSTA